MKVGAPSAYTQAKANAICEALRSGMSLLAYCKAKGAPSQSMVYRWLEDRPEFREMYARAREAQGSHYAAEIIEIADGVDAPDNKRVRIDARKWYASKLAPKVYGDKVSNEHSGPGGEPLKVEHIVRTIFDPAG